MSKKSKILEVVIPEYTDDVHIPTFLEEIVNRFEEVLVKGDSRVGGTVGDLKLSVQAADHGRWLKMDGRELTQANIEAALGLTAGEGKPICDLLVTGAASKYGAAAVGKVKLADTRRRMTMGAGPAADGDGSLTERVLGSVGGEEKVKLTGAQSGIKAHKHTVTDPEHLHGVTDPGHGHTASQAAHQHRYGFDVTPNAVANGPFGQYVFNGSFANSAYTDYAQPSVTVNNAVTGVSVKKAATGVTVNEIANTEATEGHPNMPPFVTVGFYFIRV